MIDDDAALFFYHEVASIVKNFHTSIIAMLGIFIFFISPVLSIPGTMAENSKNTTHTITILSIGNRTLDEKFTIAASTNFPVGDHVYVEASTINWHSCPKIGCLDERWGFSSTMNVTQGTAGYNMTTFEVNPGTLRPDDYIVSEFSKNGDVHSSALFTISDSPDKPYRIKIDPIRNSFKGTNVTITATTNIPVGDEIVYSICSVRSDQGFIVYYESVNVTYGYKNQNMTRIAVDLSDLFPPGEYLVSEEGWSRYASDTASFMVREKAVTGICLPDILKEFRINSKSW